MYEDDLQLGEWKENCLLLKLYRKLRKMFLSPRRGSNPQPSDLRWDALTIELPGLRWQREGHDMCRIFISLYRRRPSQNPVTEYIEINQKSDSLSAPLKSMSSLMSPRASHRRNQYVILASCPGSFYRRAFSYIGP